MNSWYWVLLLAGPVLIIVTLIWSAHEQRKENAYRASLPTEAGRHRHDMFMKYLPQSAFEAQLLDEAIKRGDTL